MTKNKRTRAIWPGMSATAVLLLGLVSSEAEAGAVGRCTADFAKSTMASSGASTLCGCEIVTLGFVRYLQNRTEFGDILEQTATQCPALATVLSETPTANINQPRRQNEERPEREGPPRNRPTPPSGPPASPPSEPPASPPSEPPAEPPAEPPTDENGCPC